MSRWSRRSGESTPRLSVRSGETKGFFFISILFFFIFYFDKREMRRNYKILLLGTGESGKSTFMRNLRVVHGSGFSTKERQDAREVSLSTLRLGRESVSMFPQVIVSNLVITVYLILCQMDLQKVNIWSFWARKTNLTNRTCGANLIWCVA